MLRFGSSLARRFAANRSGNFTIMFAGAAVALLLAAGVAVDIGRAITTKSEMRNALDAAILAAARELSSGRLKENQVAAFLENYVEGTLGVELGAGLQYQLVDVRVDTANETVYAKLTRDLPLTLASVAGLNSREYSSESMATYGFGKAEVAMTLDITGSMKGSKLSDLKRAAKHGIEELLAGNDPLDPDIRVTTIPYAAAVNVGLLKNVIFVENRDNSGEPPADTDVISVSSSSAPDDCATERKGKFQFTDDNPARGLINRDYRVEDCPETGLSPLTADKDRLLKSIDSFKAEGTTAGHIGIQWAWYMISPVWKDYVPAPSVAAEYDKDTRKFMIIMTDGEFNTAYAGVSRWQDVGQQSSKSLEYARKLCDNIKKKNIEVFTIGFALKEKSAKDVLKYCATANSTDVKYYYDVSTGAELKQVYSDIANTIKALRLIR
jgi:Flp pilus assembly protein TadG